MRHLRKTLIAAGVAGGLLTAMPLMASPNENEVDTTGLVGAVGIAYGDHTVNSELVNSLKVDSYIFPGEAGDEMIIRAHTFTGGLDASLTLRDPTGGILATTYCNGFSGSLCSASISQALATAGNYTINVSDIGLDEAGRYQLHLDRYPPVNNWVGLQYSTAFAASLGHTTDMDFFAFNGTTGTGVSVALAGKSGGLDPLLEIWDPSGVQIFNQYCNGFSGSLCTLAADINITSSGIYKVGISETNADETGNYQLGVSCLFGNCPSSLAAAPVPLPVPEPGTYAMFLSGIGALALFARRRSQRKS